jgi:oligopeptidase A
MAVSHSRPVGPDRDAAGDATRVADTAGRTAIVDDSGNALLEQRDLPRFAEFEPGQVQPAVTRLIADAEAALARAVDPATPATWADFHLPLQLATERLGRAWGMVRHLNSVLDSPPLREAFNERLPAITEFWTRLGQDVALFAKYRALREGPDYATLDAEQRKVIDNEIRDFRLGGAELVSPARERYAAIAESLARLSQKFSENVLDATNAFDLVITDPARLEGLPADALEAAAADAKRKGLDGYRFTLQLPSYLPVMQFARDRELRRTLYEAYTSRATSEPTDNTPLMHEILALREERAQLLGYDSYAELSLVPKMADSPQAVATFLEDLARRARPFAERDLNELREFAAKELGLTTLEAWDVPFASEHLQQARYAFSDNTVKQYFPLPRVLDGLFGLIERLFSVKIRPDEAQAWHPDVGFYRIEDGGRLVGQFYLDLYARESKQPGAWMDDCRGRQRLPRVAAARAASDGIQTPVAYLVCNFQPPVGDRPSLLRHDDVSTLFHEFGHGLHHLLTRVGALGVSGISGVEWDAVELPSQFMENWAWEWQIVESMSRHVDTGEPMPRALFDKMVAARNFQAGLQTLRQIEFALFDIRLHGRQALANAPAGPVGRDAIQRVLDAVRRDVAVLIPPASNRFQNSFSHIFSGGYAAGYYSYKWAEVLSADCFAAFEEEGLFDAGTGSRFLDEILSVGGSRPAIDSFRAFRGREPRLDALLRHNGMVEQAA